MSTTTTSIFQTNSRIDGLLPNSGLVLLVHTEAGPRLIVHTSRVNRLLALIRETFPGCRYQCVDPEHGSRRINPGHASFRLTGDGDLDAFEDYLANLSGKGGIWVYSI